MKVARWPVLLLLAAIVAGLVVLDQRAQNRDDTPIEVPTGALVPMAPAGDALGATWFCAAGTADDAGAADHVLVMTNFGEQAIEGQITAFPAAVGTVGTSVSFEPIETAVSVAAGTVAELRVADIVTGQYAAALLEFDSPEIVVEHRLDGDLGTAIGPCATSASREWFFPGGSTARDARMVLALFNPFPDDALAEITFATDEGIRAPLSFEPLVVPGRTLVPVDVGVEVSRWNQLSVDIRTRAGRLVAERLLVFDGTEGRTGLEVELGAPGPAAAWTFPAGSAEPGVSHSYVIYNPNDEAALVDLEIRLDTPSVNGEVEPFELTIPARQRQVVLIGDGIAHPVSDTSTVLAGTRVPPGVGHWATVRALNDRPIVAERITTVGVAGDPDDETAADRVVGVASTIGSPLIATDQVLSVTAGSRLAVVNPSADGIVQATVLALVDGVATDIPELTALEIGPGSRLDIQLSQFLPADTAAVVVTGTAPLVVERSVATDLSLVNSLAVPTGATGVPAPITLY